MDSGSPGFGYDLVEKGGAGVRWIGHQFPSLSRALDQFYTGSGAPPDRRGIRGRTRWKDQAEMDPRAKDNLMGLRCHGLPSQSSHRV